MSKYPYIQEMQSMAADHGFAHMTRVLIRNEIDEEKFNKVMDPIYAQMRKDGYSEAVIEAYRNRVKPQ
jgi:hypothetical protein